METGHEPHEHDQGLAHDLTTLMHRRRALGVMAGAGLFALVGCGTGASDSTASSTTSTTAGTAPTTAAAAAGGTIADADCTAIPEETAGPYPGDGSNGPNALTESGVVRRDITTSFGSSSGTAEGAPLTVTLTLTDATSGCAPLAGAAVYLWHCDRDGEYSMYGTSIADQNYLRGVQEADSKGQVTFDTIFPGAYPGRWPHMHFEVYPSLTEATSTGTPSATSQLALPEDVCTTVYATAGYEQSAKSMKQTSLSRDMVFSDGVATQLATVAGTVADGLTAQLDVPVGPSSGGSGAGRQ